MTGVPCPVGGEIKLAACARNQVEIATSGGMSSKRCTGLVCRLFCATKGGAWATPEAVMVEVGNRIATDRVLVIPASPHPAEVGKRCDEVGMRYDLVPVVPASPHSSFKVGKDKVPASPHPSHSPNGSGLVGFLDESAKRRVWESNLADHEASIGRLQEEVVALRRGLEGLIEVVYARLAALEQKPKRKRKEAP